MKQKTIAAVMVGFLALTSCDKPGEEVSNINIQMNYCLAETTNLPELAEPLFSMLTAGVPVYREATAKEYGADTRRSKSMATSASPPASPESFSKATRVKSACFLPYPPSGRPACVPAVA